MGVELVLAQTLDRNEKVRLNLRQFLEEAIAMWGGSPKSEGGN
jgi:hypothetical protein